jgi:hypothetical protein
MRRFARVLSAMTLLLCAFSAGSQPAQTQRVVQFVNDGDAPIEVIVVELKKVG